MISDDCWCDHQSPHGKKARAKLAYCTCCWRFVLKEKGQGNGQGADA